MLCRVSFVKFASIVVDFFHKSFAFFTYFNNLLVASVSKCNVLFYYSSLTFPSPYFKNLNEVRLKCPDKVSLTYHRLHFLPLVPFSLNFQYLQGLLRHLWLHQKQKCCHSWLEGTCSTIFHPNI